MGARVTQRRETGADGAVSNKLRIIRSFAMISEEFFGTGEIRRANYTGAPFQILQTIYLTY
jgi:hypothetical protein